MTKRERAKVVELLRCAADLADLRGDELTMSGPFSVASRNFDRPIVDRAWRARVETMRALFGPLSDTDDIANDAYKAALLNAAARVEEGSWP